MFPLPKILKNSTENGKEKGACVSVYGEGEGDTKMKRETDVLATKMRKGKKRE